MISPAHVLGIEPSEVDHGGADSSETAEEVTAAHSGHRERRDRFIVNAPIGAS
jgi:hypothetical protein